MREKIPLIEIIVEIKWKLQELVSLHARIDPHFEEFYKDFGDAVTQQGFNFFEPLVPDEIPREFTAGQPLYRFRKKADGYPLFQIGYGLLTVNTAPTTTEPYTGWDNFIETIKLATKTLFERYPVANKYLKIDHLELKYINAFDKDYGYQQFLSFAKDSLGITIVSTNTPILEALDENADFQLSYQGKFKSAPNDIGYIKIYPGAKHDINRSGNRIPALFAELGMRTHLKETVASQDKIVEWLDKAHGTISDDWFENLIKGDIRSFIGDK
jgi:uncharacterized protein (TIGR04255 family)